MTRPLAARAGTLLALALAVFGCGQAEPAAAPPEVTPRAALLPPGDGLSVGRISAVVIAVRMPSGHRVLPVPAPRLEGAEILSVHSDVRELDRGSWLHRTVLQLRPLEPGVLDWPATAIEVEAPDGNRVVLALEARKFDVDSILGRERPDRQPYGLRSVPEPVLGAGFASGLLVGGLLAGLSTALLFRLRRASQTGKQEESRDIPRTPTRNEAGPHSRRALDEARALAASDPRAASNAGAALLRVFASRRFGCELQALTTEEIAERGPAALPSRCLSQLLALLRRYDADRFRPQSAGPGRADVSASLEATERFVEAWADGGRK